MNCMKCGRETAEDQIFCDLCLEEMERYPVRPGTVILLPRRRTEAAPRKPVSRRKQTLSPEEQIRTLKKLSRRLAAAVIVLLALLAATSYFAVLHLLEGDSTFLPGQNYSSVTASEAPEME